MTSVYPYIAKSGFHYPDFTKTLLSKKKPRNTVARHFLVTLSQTSRWRDYIPLRSLGSKLYFCADKSDLPTLSSWGLFFATQNIIRRIWNGKRKDSG